MFERYTDAARAVITDAEKAAKDLVHNYVGTEHILPGLLKQEQGIAAKVLSDFNISYELVQAEVIRMVGTGEELNPGKPPFTPRAIKVLELTLREALNLGHAHIEPEHILLGLIRESEGVAIRILYDFGAEPIALRDAVIRALAMQS